jgi:hypothetical protein
MHARLAVPPADTRSLLHPPSNQDGFWCIPALTLSLPSLLPNEEKPLRRVHGAFAVMR